MIDWSYGYSARLRVVYFNTETWSDGEELEGVSNVSITNDGSSNAPLLSSASMNVSIPMGEEFDDGWYKIKMIATQNPENELVDLGVFLFESSGDDRDKGSKLAKLNGYSVLKPAADEHIRGYAPRGVSGPEWVRDKLQSCCKAPVSIDADILFTLADQVVFEESTSILSAVWKVLDTGGWIMQLYGDGSIHLMPKPTEPDLILDAANASLLAPAIQYEHDKTDIPNRLTVVTDSETVTVVNDKPSSETSTVARGRIVDERENNPTRKGGETLTAYANRRLEELSTLTDKYTYTREYWPGIYPYSIVQGSLRSLDMMDQMSVMSQKIDLGHGISVNETAGLEVKLWTRE